MEILKSAILYLGRVSPVPRGQEGTPWDGQGVAAPGAGAGFSLCHGESLEVWPHRGEGRCAGIWVGPSEKLSSPVAIWDPASLSRAWPSCWKSVRGLGVRDSQKGEVICSFLFLLDPEPTSTFCPLLLQT